MKIAIALSFNRKGYIANPFWPEQKKLIEIQKCSGFNRLRNEAKRKQTLLAYLEKEGMTMTEYEALQVAATRAFYTVKNEIVIPPRNFQSFLANVARVAKSAQRAIEHNQVAVVVELQEPGLRTGKTKPDGVFSRFVKSEESNERMLAEDSYIKDFTARGALEVREEMVNPKDLKSMIEWGGKYVGIGSARPQGYGRFALVEFT